MYPIGRFLLEFIRIDPSVIGGINANQITMAIVAVFSSIMLFVNHRKIKSNGAEEVKTPEELPEE